MLEAIDPAGPIRILTIFKCQLQSCTYYMGNGKPIIFQSGKYLTDDSTEIEALKEEIRKGHPHIYIDPKEETVKSDDLNPMNVIKKKHFEEFLEEQRLAHERALDPMANISESKQESLKAASTTNIAAAMAGAGAGASLTKLVNLTQR